MIIKYYKNDDLIYSNRKRFNSFNYEPFKVEMNNSVVLGDGAKTSIKTKIDNLCDYVTIDDTRWFVVSYTYMNGSQITLNLQRDVIGEKGLYNCFGKIERGYTDSLLRNRKELNLNEILKERKYLIPNTNTYGNFTVSTHDNELWGVIYLVKPTGNDPETGKPYPDEVNINIPAFAPEYVNYPVIEDNAKFITSTYNSNVSQNIYFDIDLVINGKYKSNSKCATTILYTYNLGEWTYEVTNIRLVSESPTGYFYHLAAVATTDGGIYTVQAEIELAYEISQRIGRDTLNNINTSISFPDFNNLSPDLINYDNVTVKEGSTFYQYSSSLSIETDYGSTSFNNMNTYLNDKYGQITLVTLGVVDSIYDFRFGNEAQVTSGFTLSSELKYYVKTYKRNTISANNSGNIVINVNKQLVDEPYYVLLFPLYNVTITSSSKTYNIKKSEAFNIFNTVIQYLSGGNNPYLIDAQIFPYCPLLTSVSTELQGYPFFNIVSNTFSLNSEIQLLPYSDVKKEYIIRKYSMISPEKTGNFSFNFYDYTNDIEDKDGLNYKKLSITIKNALKPFAIISSAVITPDVDSLMGITYSSDMRGSQPSSNGFECSLASNAFQTYKRENSNYQQIFALQKEELQRSHHVEWVNEITGAIVNTATATAMGAIAGGAVADAGVWNSFGAKAAGAAIGSVTAGAAVGTAMGFQVSANEDLRKFERNLQQQNFDLQIGTIKALPNSINRISSFNEIMLQDFWYVIEIYECSEYEKQLVNDFINSYSYGIGVFGYIVNFIKDKWFIRSTLIKSNFLPILHNVAADELMGGIYYYE